MRAISFEGCNVNLVAEGCFDLPVRHEGGAFLSLWSLSKEERLSILDGGHVGLRIHGNGHPPVSLAVYDAGLQIQETPRAPFPKAMGIARCANNPASVALIFRRPLTDDEVRAVHDAVNAMAVTQS